MAEHLLDAPEVGAALEQMGRERVSKQMWVHASRLEPCTLGEPSEDEKSACTRERSAFRVQEQRARPTSVEVRAPA
jgi:hypothetical protein